MKTKILILIALFNLTISNSQVTYVKKEAQGLNNGTSWENAYIDLDYAIENTESGEIWVSAGVYIPSTDIDGKFPTNEAFKTFRIKPNIELYGGFLGDEVELAQRDWINNPTILSGDLGIQGDLTDNVSHVLSSSHTNLNINTIIDGFTIRDGNAYWGYSDGGGIYVDQAYDTEFVLRNNIIENNYAFGKGGGMYIFRGNPIVENNIFRNNQALKGGAIYLYYSDASIKNNEILENSAGPFFKGTSSLNSGGGIYIGVSSRATVDSNLIKGNYAEHEGGGITIIDNYHTVFKNNLVLENTSNNGGGLMLYMSNTFFFNNIFVKNQADKNGGGLYMYYVDSPEFINNTIADNIAGVRGGGLYLTASNINLVNSIVYYNQSPQGSQISVYANWTPKFRYSNIQYGEAGMHSRGNSYIYENNIDTPPLFANSAEDNYRLMEQSTSINSGTMASDIISGSWIGTNGEIINFPSTDFEGNPRIFETIDIGAYELSGTLSIPQHNLQHFTFYPNPSTGIFNLDPKLNFDSVTIFDINGRKIKSIYKESSLSSFNLSNYNNGIYIVVTKLKRKNHFSKIILSK